MTIDRATILRVAAALALSASVAPFAVRPVAAQTAGSASITITPPFFTLNVSPGDAWASSIRVVNTNAGAQTVTASVMGFAPADEEGHGTFVKLAGLANDPDQLANWITLPSPSVAVPVNGAANIPFSVAVPRDASPGGHYAAILIGVAPPSAAGTGSHVGVSSFVSALIFVRVAGDITEAGNIQEFSTDKAMYQDPSVDFTVRFENTGNVHVRPVGEIQIYNAFGKEQGSIPINQGGAFGYVLPSSTRRFDASWQGPAALWDIGQYSAVVTLAYGEDGTKSASQSLTFWVLPIWRLAEDALGLIIVIGFFIFFLRRYVRKLLTREMGLYAPQKQPSKELDRSPKERNGMVDLRKK